MFGRQNPSRPSIRTQLSTAAGNVNATAEEAIRVLALIGLVAVVALALSTVAIVWAVTG